MNFLLYREKKRGGVVWALYKSMQSASREAMEGRESYPGIPQLPYFIDGGLLCVAGGALLGSL